TGIEPVSGASETLILSIVLRGHQKNCYGRTCIWSFVPTVLWGLYYPLYYEAIKRTVMVEPASGASSPQYCEDYTINCTTRPSKELLWSNLHLELILHSTVRNTLSIVLRVHQKNCYDR